MIYSINMTDIQKILLDALEKSSEVNDYCLEKYGKPLLIIGKYDSRKPLTKADCPAFVIMPESKIEGDDLSEYSYRFWGALQVSSPNQDEVVSEVHHLTQLIYSALHFAKGEERPVSEFSADFDHTNSKPLDVVFMNIVYTITPALE